MAFSIVLSSKFSAAYSLALKQLPIPKINSKNNEITDRIIRLVDRIIKAKEKNFNANTSKLEIEINNLVYELYDLSKAEIRIIEKSNRN